MSRLIAVIDRSDRSEGYGELFTEQRAIQRVGGMREVSMPNIQNGYVSDPDELRIIATSATLTFHPFFDPIP